MDQELSTDNQFVNIHLEVNEIFENNEPWTPPVSPPPTASTDPYVGGGVAIVGTFFDDDAVGRTITVLNNWIHDNSIEAPAGFDTGPAPTEVGGGLYIDLVYGETLDGATTPFEIFGNHINYNTAVDEGGGAHLGAYRVVDTPGVPVFLFRHNTVAANELVGSSPNGTEVYIPYDTSGTLALGGSSRVEGDSNVMFNPDPLHRDWFAFCGAGAGTPPVWIFTQMEAYPASPGCIADGYDLFGPDCDDANPNLDPTPDLISRLGHAPPCAETGNAAPIFPSPVIRDWDGNLRINGVPDRGADELPTISRGDSNNDNSFDISDSVFSLAALFTAGSPAPPVLDAADANNDGNFDISDPVYTLAALFVAGAPPVPAPSFPDCGLDDDVDNILASQLNSLGCP